MLLNALRYEVLECSMPTVEPTDGMVDGTDEWAHDGVCEVGTDEGVLLDAVPAAGPARAAASCSTRCTGFGPTVFDLSFSKHEPTM